MFNCFWPGFHKVNVSTVIVLLEGCYDQLTNINFFLFFFFVEHACGDRDIVFTTSVQCMCIVCASVGICPGHNFYSCAWISK